MTSRFLPHRVPAVLLMAVCVLLPALLALVAVGLGSAAPSTQGLAQATGAIAAAALHGLDRRAPELAPRGLMPVTPPLAPDLQVPDAGAARACDVCAPDDLALAIVLPLRL